MGFRAEAPFSCGLIMSGLKARPPKEKTQIEGGVNRAPYKIARCESRKLEVEKLKIVGWENQSPTL